jgi:predicted protein tyrosine phosphatase
LPNLLFICSKNQWRSPTAELLFKNHATHSAKSAGTSDKARIKVNQKMIAWADFVFVMERKHRKILEQNFPLAVASKLIIVLDIEDNYQFNAPELIDILRISLQNYL